MKKTIEMGVSEMGIAKIKNYDILITRVFQIILPFFLGCFVVLIIAGIIDGGNFGSLTNIMTATILFEDNIGDLFFTWGIIIFMEIVIIKRSFGKKIHNSIILNQWLRFKGWVLSLGNDVEQ